jgi:hypothetical protein
MFNICVVFFCFLSLFFRCFLLKYRTMCVCVCRTDLSRTKQLLSTTTNSGEVFVTIAVFLAFSIAYRTLMLGSEHMKVQDRMWLALGNRIRLAFNTMTRKLENQNYP